MNVWFISGFLYLIQWTEVLMLRCHLSEYIRYHVSESIWAFLCINCAVIAREHLSHNVPQTTKTDTSLTKWKLIVSKLWKKKKELTACSWLSLWSWVNSTSCFLPGRALLNHPPLLFYFALPGLLSFLVQVFYCNRLHFYIYTGFIIICLQ